MKTALLLSGGMDSLSIAWWKRPQLALTIDYGQLAAMAEVEASRAICKALEIEHHVLHLDCRALGSGDMAGTAANGHAPASDWWPYRNQMLITFAAMKAISEGVKTLLIGTVRSDQSHVDGRPEFVRSINALLELQEGNLAVEAPAISMSTAELVRTSGVPPALLAWSHSCHRANVACAACRGCNKHFEVLEELQNGMAQSG